MKLDVIEKELLKNKNSRVFSFVQDGKKYWLKQPQMGEANFWHSLLFFLSKLSKNNFFKPTVVKDPTLSIVNEAKKLKKLDGLDIKVPKLIYSDERCLVVEDSGVVLSKIIDDSGYPFEFKDEVLGKFAATLAKMNNSGFYHSRPALRDATYKDDEVFLIDFEENLDDTLSPNEAIVRDGFLFIHTLFRKVDDEKLIENALLRYKKELNPALYENLKNEAKKYGFLYFVLKFTYKYLGKDAKAIFKTLRYIKEEDDG